MNGVEPAVLNLPTYGSSEDNQPMAWTSWTQAPASFQDNLPSQARSDGFEPTNTPGVIAGQVILKVMSCSGLPWGLDMNKDVGIQVCVRERIIWPNGQEEISYGKSQWTKPYDSPTVELDVRSPLSAQLVVAAFDLTKMDPRERFLGEVVLNIIKLLTIQRAVKDTFPLQRSKYAPDVPVAGSVSMLVKWSNRANGSSLQSTSALVNEEMTPHKSTASLDAIFCCAGKR